ncbi:Nose resistant to fluoxetine protein 6 [Fragariocoptes setiger]|uniref:Nose resistant to fluoxetine protein 6 n=1 Tax=Fragariocoptes setiger TaxID=1670756 RepID=A0ABQ7S8W5_9ACAR|nr:Nose resistant to fluoxetine protein 6 [Fragariocoptes setiger]
MIVLSTLALMTVVGTVVDLHTDFDEDVKISDDNNNKEDKNCDKERHYKNNNNNKTSVWLRVCRAFSMRINARDLFKTTPAQLNCVQGLRFFSMCWVIYAHTILYTDYQSFTHMFASMENNLTNFFLLPTLNANFSVDTFFLISGLLTSYGTYRMTNGKVNRFKSFYFVLSRYIRLTPQLVIVMLMFLLLPLIGEGPMLNGKMEYEAGKCYRFWWVNMLYLQAFYNNELCIGPAWWVSVEMFFHISSALILAIMLRNTRAGMLLTFMFTSALTLLGAYIHYTGGFTIQALPTIPQRYEVDGEQAYLFFHKPYPHAASFFIGLALGFVIARNNNVNINANSDNNFNDDTSNSDDKSHKVERLNAAQVRSLWVACWASFVVIFWAPYYWNMGAAYTQLQSTVYYNACQIVWPMCIAWIIYACVYGHAGLINSILSSCVFTPLGRISYMTYLSHAIVVYYSSYSGHVTVEPTFLTFMYLHISNTVLSLVLGFILTIVYESPILRLTKLLFALMFP